MEWTEKWMDAGFRGKKTSQGAPESYNFTMIGIPMQWTGIYAGATPRPRPPLPAFLFRQRSLARPDLSPQRHDRPTLRVF